MRNPPAAVALLLGAAGITAGYVAALAAAGQAFGVQLPLATIAAVFLCGSAVASAASTPGGLGALEAALVARLTAAGSASGPPSPQCSSTGSSPTGFLCSPGRGVPRATTRGHPVTLRCWNLTAESVGSPT